MFLFLLSLNIIFIKPIKVEDIIKKFNKNFSNKSQKKNDDEDIFEITDYELINPQDPDYFYIPIFSSSDIHGHFYPEEFGVGKYIYTQGGLDYLAKYANIIRNEFNNQFLYLDAGDIFQGGTESSLSNGDIILDYFNLVNANGSTFGNHEFDYEKKFIDQKVKDAKFPFLATNLYDTVKRTKKVFGENHFSSQIYTFNFTNNNKNEEKVQIKIGVVGLAMKMTQDTISGEGYDDIIFYEYKDALVEEVNNLRKEDGVKAVVLLSHIGIGCGKGDNLTLNMYKPSDIQEECSESSDLYKLLYDIDEGLIDAVVTGHSHREVHHFIRNIPVISPVNNGLYANIIYLAFNKNNNYNIERDKVRIEGPLPVCEKIFKGSLRCEFIKENELQKYLPLMEYTFHNVKIEKDPTLQPIHDKYDDIYNQYNEKLCSLIGTEDVLNIYKNGSFYLGNIMADMMRIVTGANISIVSYGTLRTSWNPGRIPRFKVQDLLPYGNSLCTFQMNGEEVKRMMKILQTGVKKKYYVTSGVKQIMSKDKEGEYYLSSIKLFDGIKEQELIPEQNYLISTNNFLIKEAGDDFNKVLPWYKPRNLNCEYGLESDAMEIYLRKQQIIDVRKYMDDNNPRIRFIGGEI